MKIALNKINRKQLLIAVLILVRLIFIYFATKYEATYLKKDSNHYLILSESIKDYFFNDDLEEFWMPTTRTIGYPFILSLLGKVTEIGNYIYLNFIVDLFISIVLFRTIGQLTKNRSIQYIGAALFLANPNVLISSSQVMTESLSTLFFLLSISYLIKRDSRSIVLAGISIGLFSFIKPMGHILLLLSIVIGVYWFKYNLKQVILLSCIPILCMVGTSYNNYVQYESFFYSTSSYFHLQWFNGASDALCEKIDFNQLEVNEPGYVFDEWKKELDSKTLYSSGLFIEALKDSSTTGITENIRCKSISTFHSMLWNFLGIRSTNWSETYLNHSLVSGIIFYSYTYVLFSAFAFVYFLLSKKHLFLSPIIFIISSYTLITSVTLPYGNARTRVLIEPFVVIVMSYLINELSMKKKHKSKKH